MKKIDLHHLFTKILFNIPIKITKYLINLNNFGNIVYGNEYIKYKNFLNKNQEKFDNTEMLIELLKKSIKNVPYYKNYYHIKNTQDFTKEIPFITKEIINNDYKKFISKNITLSDYKEGTTGGTSGKPLQLFIPKNSYIVEWGTMHKLWENVGFNNDIKAVIRNNKLPKNKNYIINPITKEYIFDGFRLNDDYFKLIYYIMKENNIQFIHSYPSTALVFSKFLYKNKFDTSFIKAFLSGSENIYPFQKDFIRNKLNIKFYGWYGHSEKILLGGFCKSNDLYHMEPSYGHIELINKEGQNITKIGEVGEVVATTLRNEGMPLIRYRTNDFAEYAGSYCPDCNRHLLLLKNIQGRRDGTKIYTSNKESFTTGLLEYDKELLSVIDGLQHVQKKVGELEVHIIKNSIFTNNDHQKFIEYYNTGFYKNIKTEIIYVDNLKKHSNGKFIELISELNGNEFE